MHLRVTDVVWAGWFALFLALEFTAVFKVTPWQTLSSTVWTIETDWQWTKWIFLIGIAVLLVHIVGQWPGGPTHNS